MSVLKTLQDQQSTTARSSPSTSLLDGIEQQLSALTKAVNDLSGYVKVMDEVHVSKLQALTSQRPEPPSTLPLDDAVMRRIAEIEKTLAAVASQLSASAAVKLPDGSSVRRSDLEAHSLVTRLEKQIEAMTSSSAELAEAVRKRGRVTIDTEKLQEHTIRVLDKRLARAVESPVVRVEASLAGLEGRVTALGEQRLRDAAKQAQEVLDKTDAVVASMRSAEERVRALESKVTWVTAGRVGLALLPLAATVLVLGGLTMGIAHALGFGPLLSWAWGAFGATELWWQKALIALATLGGVCGFGWVAWGVTGRVMDAYRRW